MDPDTTIVPPPAPPQPCHPPLPLSLRQLAPEALIEQLKKKTLCFRSLHRPERLEIVACLMHDHFQGEIAQLLGCSVDTVKRDEALLRQRGAKMVGKLTVDVQAATLLRAAHFLSKRAASKGDYRTAWAILKELNEQLQSMGLVKRVVLEHKITHTFEEQTDEQLAAALRGAGSHHLN